MGAEFVAFSEQVAQHLPAGNTFTCLQTLKHLLEQIGSSLRVSVHFEQPGIPDLIIHRDGIATGYIFIGDETISQAEDALPNVLYTDYLAFRHNDQTAQLGTLTDGQVTPKSNTESVMHLQV